MSGTVVDSDQGLRVQVTQSYIRIGRASWTHPSQAHVTHFVSRCVKCYVKFVGNCGPCQANSQRNARLSVVTF